jgi:hypothetical protein
MQPRNDGHHSSETIEAAVVADSPVPYTTGVAMPRHARHTIILVSFQSRSSIMPPQLEYFLPRTLIHTNSCITSLLFPHLLPHAYILLLFIPFPSCYRLGWRMRVLLAQLHELDAHGIVVFYMRQGAFEFLVCSLSKELTHETLTAFSFDAPRNAVVAVMAALAWPSFGVTLGAWYVVRLLRLFVLAAHALADGL